jgi:hypothetical protein
LKELEIPNWLSLLHNRFLEPALGRQGETFVTARLMAVGYIVLIPVDGTQRYDMVIEDANRQFWRIQCKKGRFKEGEGVVEFTLRSSGSFRQGKWAPQSYKNDAIDYFAICCRELNKVYLVPSNLVGVNTAWLRISEPKSKRRGGRNLPTKWAADYEL